VGNSYFFNLLLFILLSILLVETKVYGQQIVKLTGRVVTDDKGLGVPDATIGIDSVKRVFSTDENGHFTLLLPTTQDKYVLKVSKVGYVSKAVQTGSDKKDVLIKLEIANNILEEVEINTGYQQIPQERSTGSFGFVDENLFNRQIGTDVISRLDGIMPSVLFDKRNGGERSMIIRGVASLGLAEDRSPLIIVDNFPFEGDINSINPNDVASVTLLKDAAAASIWGARAGNGVLVITTKRGKFNAPWRATFTANTTFSDKPNLFYTPQMSSAEFLEVEKFLFENGTFNSALNNTTNRPPLTPYVELLAQHAAGQITDQQLEDRTNYYSEQDVRKDVSRYLYRGGFNQQYAFSLSGGGERYNTLFSLGYDNNRSASVGNSFSRLNTNLQNTIQVLPKLNIQLGMRYSLLKSHNNNPGNIQMLVGRDIYPYARLADNLGQPLIVEKDYRSSYLDEIEAGGRLLDWRYRPLQEVMLADNTNKSNNMMLNAKVTYELFRGLSSELNYQYEYQPTIGRQFFNENTYYTRNLINRFTQLDGEQTTYGIPIGGILDRNYTDLHAHSVRGQLNYNAQFGSHDISVIGGAELRRSETTGNTTRLYGFNDELLTSNVVNYVDRLPIYDNLSGPSAIVYRNNEFGRQQRFVSLYTNGAYTYDGRYTLSFSARKDASNLFGVETNDKWNPLWSVGGAWNVASESWYEDSFLTVLRLRTTYGYSGNVRNDVSAVTTLEYGGISRIGRFPYATAGNPPNPQLRWERIGTLNVGLDFGLKGNYLSGSVEYYRKTASDLISLVSADPTSGFTTLSLNSAIIRNEGVDIAINSRLGKGNVSWLGNFMFSINKNKVIRYLREASRLSQWVGNGGAVSPIEGQPAYPLVSYRWEGLDGQTGDPIGILDGERSTDYALLYQQVGMDGLVFHGSALPEQFGGFRNTFEWKSFAVSANITYRTGYFFRRETINYTPLLSVNAQVGHADYRYRWQQPGDEMYTDVPSLIYPNNSRRNDFYRNSEVTAEKGDHIRLQDINITYRIDGENSKLPFKWLDIKAYARNLAILWRANTHKLDPDVRGMPLATTWSFGVNATF